jgi:putative DNA primase/helicase
MSFYRSTTKSILHKGARQIAAKGKPVFPCKPGGKDPLTEHGHHDATTDPRKINAWWNRWPDANIGMPTGKRSDVFVVDADEDKGGLESLAKLEAENEPLPTTARARTGRGGLHLYFKYPSEGEIRNSASKLGPGLDVRGEGGYVLVPPSITEGRYEWL